MINKKIRIQMWQVQTFPINLKTRLKERPFNIYLWNLIRATLMLKLALHVCSVTNPIPAYDTPEFPALVSKRHNKNVS